MDTGETVSFIFLFFFFCLFQTPKGACRLLFNIHLKAREDIGGEQPARPIVSLPPSSLPPFHLPISSSLLRHTPGVPLGNAT